MAQYKYSKWSNVVSYADYLVTAHIARVAQQGGTIDSPALLNLYVLYLVNNNLMSSQYIGAIPSVTGYKEGSVAGNCQIVFSVDPSGSTTGSYIGDMVQNTVVNQPALLKYSGEKYYWGSGDGNNYCSAPKAIASANIYEVIAKINVSTFSNGYIFTANGGAVSVAFEGASKKIYFDISNGGGGSVTSTVGVPYTTNQDFYIKVNRNVTVVKMYTSADGVIWTQLGTDLTISATNFVTITQVGIGCYLPAPVSTYSFNGRVYSCTLTVNNVLTVNFSFANYNPAISETTWTATTGETWTLNSPTDESGKNNYSSTIVTRTCLQNKLNDAMTTVGTWAQGTPVTQMLIASNISNAVTTSGGVGVMVINKNEVSFADGALYSNPSANYLGIISGGLLPTIPTPFFRKKRIHSMLLNYGASTAAFNINKEAVVSGSLNYSDSIFKGAKIGNAYQANYNFFGLVVSNGTHNLDNSFKDFLNTTIFNGEIY